MRHRARIKSTRPAYRLHHARSLRRRGRCATPRTLGVMKSVLRVDCRMFSRDAARRSCSSCRAGSRGDVPATTRASFQARLSASATARVAAARAERRDDMGGVAGEDRAAVHEALHHAAGEGVDARPFVLPARLGAEHLAQPAVDVLGLLLLVGIGVAAELEVDPQDVVGLAVQQHRVGRMERRVEPEAPFLRQVAREPDVGDQELVVEDLAGIRQAQHVRTGLRTPSQATSQSASSV